MVSLNPFMNQVYLYHQLSSEFRKTGYPGLNPFMNQVYLYARQRASEYAAYLGLNPFMNQVYLY